MLLSPVPVTRVWEWWRHCNPIVIAVNVLTALEDFFSGSLMRAFENVFCLQWVSSAW